MYTRYDSMDRSQQAELWPLLSEEITDRSRRKWWSRIAVPAPRYNLHRAYPCNNLEANYPTQSRYRSTSPASTQSGQQGPAFTATVSSRTAERTVSQVSSLAFTDNIPLDPREEELRVNYALLQQARDWARLLDGSMLEEKVVLVNQVASASIEEARGWTFETQRGARRTSIDARSWTTATTSSRSSTSSPSRSIESDWECEAPKQGFQEYAQFIGLAFFLGLVPLVGCFTHFLIAYLKVYRPLSRIKVPSTDLLALKRTMCNYMIWELFIGLVYPLGCFFRLAYFNGNLRIVRAGERLVVQHADQYTRAFVQENGSTSKSPIHTDRLTPENPTPDRVATLSSNKPNTSSRNGGVGHREKRRDHVTIPLFPVTTDKPGQRGFSLQERGTAQRLKLPRSVPPGMRFHEPHQRLLDQPRWCRREKAPRKRCVRRKWWIEERGFVEGSKDSTQKTVKVAQLDHQPRRVSTGMPSKGHGKGEQGDCSLEMDSNIHTDIHTNIATNTIDTTSQTLQALKDEKGSGERCSNRQPNSVSSALDNTAPQRTRDNNVYRSFIERQEKRQRQGLEVHLGRPTAATQVSYSHLIHQQRLRYCTGQA